MKRTYAFATSIITTLLIISPFAIVAASSSSSGSDFYYSPLAKWTQATPDGSDPQGIPLCGSGGGTIVCYSPGFISTAYNFPSSLDGTGQTIVIVDAYGSPTISEDLVTFDSTFGIPAPPSFTILCPQGGCPKTLTAGPHDPIGWGVETSLDVEWAHAMAPGADIVLVVAASSSGNDINVAETRAISLFPGSIISQSFGIPEAFIHNNNAQVMQAHKNYLAAVAAGDTVLASAGDFGSTNGFSFTNALFPSSDPLVTSVGGTMGFPYIPIGTLTSCPALTICTSGLSTYLGPCTNPRLNGPNCTPIGYGGEQVWNEPSVSPGFATGGAPSILFTSVPTFQSGLGLSARTTPDISYNAAIDGGVLVKASFLSAAGFFVVGGTSAGSPQWASIFAIVNQQRALNSMSTIGFANGAIYSLTAAQKALAFHDITIGDDKLPSTAPGFTAVAGYDAASGWGTPNVANLVTYLS